MSCKLNYTFNTPIKHITLFDSLCSLSGRGYEREMIEKYMNKTSAFEKTYRKVGYVLCKYAKQISFQSIYINGIFPKTREREDML